MDQKENRLNVFQQDAKNAIEAHCSSELSPKETSVLMQTLSEFSAFLCAESLPGLASATVERAISFIKQQIHTVGAAAAELSRKAIEFFFQARGDLQKNQELASIAEIKKSEPAPAKEKHFAKSLSQANKACALIRQAGITQSVGTQNTYRDCLKVFCDFIKENQLGDLKNVSRDVVNRFLAHKEATVGQKTCEKYKQAIQAYLHARGDLNKDQNLPPVHSDTPQRLGRRAYTPTQVEMIQAHLTKSLAFSTELSYRCGLRAHELLTIRRIDEKRPDRRFHKDGTEKKTPWKFADRDGEAYVITGKGGLTREIRIPSDLAERLEQLRLPEARRVTDRGIYYRQHYDIVGGKRFTDCFRRASIRALGWSTGAHGLRHSYAQERIRELQFHCKYDLSKETVSQELGHFRPDITDAYLR